MSAVLFAVSLLGIFLCGFYLVSRLDKFIDSGGFSDTTQPHVFKFALIFSDQTPDPQKNRVWAADYVYEPAIPENTIFNNVFALSSSDMDNILLCAEARKISGAFTVALCSNRRYLSVFQDYHIDKVVFSMSEAGSALDAVFAQQVTEHDKNL